jgi:hypothetical protein
MVGCIWYFATGLGSIDCSYKSFGEARKYHTESLWLSTCTAAKRVASSIVDLADEMLASMALLIVRYNCLFEAPVGV